MSKTRIADGIIVKNGVEIGLEAKYIKNWGKSIMSPTSPVGKKTFATAVREKAINQLSDYASSFKTTLVHSNSQEFIAFYSSALKERGITNIVFKLISWN